jgi:hypothetical protein
VNTITLEVTTRRLAGEIATFVLPVASEDTPPRLRDGITRRRLGALHGRCPCGGRRSMNRAARCALAGKAKGQDITLAPFEHESGCPAADDEPSQAIRRWST